MSHIKSVGLELEGGWHKPFEDVSIGYDGSVKRPSNIKEAEHWGELVSDPLPPASVPEWLRTYYPDGTGNTCGFHIHTSFTNYSDYYKLTSRRFYNHFLREWERWRLQEQANYPNELDEDSPFYQRLDGLSLAGTEAAYAQRSFQPQNQLAQTGKGDNRRRTHLNYCFKLHGTLECRLLPMFYSKDLGVKAAMFYLGMVECYLENVPDDPINTIEVRG